MDTYEKKYNEALERAQKVTRAGGDVAVVIVQNIFPELAKSEDERIRQEIYDFIFDGIWHDVIINEVKQKRKYEKWLAYLEKQKESTWTEEDESFRKHILPRILNPMSWTLEQIEADRKLLKEFVERQKNKWIEKQKEQKPADLPAGFYVTLPDGKKYYTKEMRCNNMKVKVVTPQPPAWSEEDEKLFGGFTAWVPNDELERLGITRDDILKKLKSIRPQPIQLKEAYKDGFQTARHATALTFMNYLDENRPEGKMGLSNAECKDIDKAFKENDWKKIMRYADKYSWKPSEEQEEPEYYKHPV